MSDHTTKTCTKCSATYPATPEYFHRDRGRYRGGLFSWCKPCSCQSYKDYAKNNPEKVAVRSQQAYRRQQQATLKRRLEKVRGW